MSQSSSATIAPTDANVTLSQSSLPSEVPETPQQSFSGASAVPRQPFGQPILRPLRTRIAELKALDPDDIARRQKASWPTVEHERRRYILESWTYRKRKGYSWINDYGTRLLRLKENNPEETDSKWFACDKCGRLYDLKATTSASDHLELSHQIYNPKKASSNKRHRGNDDDIRVSFSRSLFNQESAGIQIVAKAAGEGIKEGLIDFLISSNMGFAVIENPEFRELLRMLNPAVAQAVMPESGRTMGRWLEDRFDRDKSRLRGELAATPHKIHLSFDLWTSPNGYAILVVVAHFADVAGILRTRLIAMPRVKGHHGGENIGAVINEVLDDYNIRDKLGVFQSDNAELNDKTIKNILDSDDVKDRRVRCLGHILNLAAKAILEGKETGLTDEPLDPAIPEDQEASAVARWRKRAAFGKLHNVVVFMRRSPQRRQSFRNVTVGDITPEQVAEFGDVYIDDNDKDLTLVQDNSTRWNSWHNMIERALRLRPAVDYWSMLQGRELEDNRLNEGDWAVLDAVDRILVKFKDLTKRYEGRQPNLSGILLDLKKLIEELKRQRFTYSRRFEVEPFEGGPDIPPRRPLAELNDYQVNEAAGRRPARARHLPARYQGHEVDVPRFTDPSQNQQQSQQSQQPQPRPRPPQEEVPIVDLDAEGDLFIRDSISLAISKLEKYVEVLEECQPYWLAMLLHPTKRKKALYSYYGAEKGASLLETFRQIFLDEYRDADRPPSPTRVYTEREGRRRDHILEDDFFDSSGDEADLDEVDSYIAMRITERDLPLEHAIDPVLWWSDSKQRDRFPKLSRMAIDILTIPAMSSEPERVFSTTRLVIGQLRHNLLHTTIERLALCKNWQSKG